uniref:Tubulin alpha chain n=1 Tax=Rhodnius prolixus TaxID=13249 RepID=R4FLP9_RHOPR
MKEVISLHVGQFGVQFGNALWELYCLEHGILPNGELQDSVIDQAGISGFYEEGINRRFSPRAVYCDLEPSVIDQVRAGEYKDLHREERLISGSEDAASNYARGRYTTGNQLFHDTAEAIRKQAEQCEQMSGFFSFHGLGGGTGSGFNSLINELISDEYCKKGMTELALFPSAQMSTSIVEPYNTVLATHATMDITNCVILVDNEAMNNLAQKQLNLEKAKYSNLNRLLSQAISATTSSIRFDSHLHSDFMDFHTNLVPFPRLHFPVLSLSPINSPEVLITDPLNTVDITTKCFDKNHRMATCTNENGLYMACCLMFRGDITTKEIHDALASLKKEVKFVDWSPTGFKIGLTYEPPITIPGSEIGKTSRSVCMLCNNSAMQTVWRNLYRKYHMMSTKGAFYHWYLSEGMDEIEFVEAGEDIRTLISDYNEVSLN